jgi:hypothetical protein
MISNSYSALTQAWTHSRQPQNATLKLNSITLRTRIRYGAPTAIPLTTRSVLIHGQLEQQQPLQKHRNILVQEFRHRNQRRRALAVGGEVRKPLVAFESFSFS